MDMHAYGTFLLILVPATLGFMPLFRLRGEVTAQNSMTSSELKDKNKIMI